MAAQLKSNIPDLVRRMREGAARAARATAHSIEGDVKESMGGAKSGRVYRRKGREHKASAEGEPPAIDSGRYANSFRVEQVDQTTFAVGTDDEKGPALELGGARTGPRPHLGPAAERAREGFGQDLREIFES